MRGRLAQDSKTEWSNVGWTVIGFSTTEQMCNGMTILDYTEYQVDVVALAWGQAWGEC